MIIEHIPVDLSTIEFLYFDLGNPDGLLWGGIFSSIKKLFKSAVKIVKSIFKAVGSLIGGFLRLFTGGLFDTPDIPDPDTSVGSSSSLVGGVKSARWVLGRARVAGNLVWFHVDGRNMQLLYVLSEGACDAIEEIYVNGELVPMNRTSSGLHTPVPGNRFTEARAGGGGRVITTPVVTPPTGGKSSGSGKGNTDHRERQPGGGTCVPGWTLVLMSDGVWKEIQHIIVGEQIQGRTRINTVQAYDRVILRYHRTPKLFEINGDYQNTDDHLTLLDTGWSVLNKQNYNDYNNEILDCVYDKNLQRVPTLFKGFREHLVSTYKIGDNIAIGFNNEYKEIESIIEVPEVDLDQTLYSLVADGDGTMIVQGGNVLSAWSDEDKWYGGV